MTATQANKTAMIADAPHRGLVILLGALTALAPFSTDMYLPAVPAVASSLRTTPSAVQQTISLFFLGMALGQLFHGPLSDRWGRRPVVIAGLMIYVAASVGCSTAGSVGPLIVWRFAQAIGGCAGVVVARAVVRDLFASHQMVRVLSLLAVVMSASPMIAPFIGAWLLHFTGWSTIFLLQALAAALLGAAVVVRLPESRPQASRDMAQGASLFSSYIPLVKDRGVRKYLVAACAPAAAAYCWVASSATIVIDDYGFPPSALGYIFGLNALGMILANALNVRLVKRSSPRRVLRKANICGVGIAMLLVVAAMCEIGGAIAFLGGMFLLVSSLAFTQGNAMIGALAASPLRAGSLSALMGSSMYFSGTFTGAIAGWLGHGSPLTVAGITLVSMLVAVLNSVNLPKGASVREGVGDDTKGSE